MIGPLLPPAWARLLPRLLDLAGGTRAPVAGGAPPAPPAASAADPARAVRDIVQQSLQGPPLLRAIVETPGGPRRLLLEALPGGGAASTGAGAASPAVSGAGPGPAAAPALAAARYLQLAGGGETAPAVVQGLDALGRLLVPFQGGLLRSVLPAPGIETGQTCRVLLPAEGEPESRATGVQARLTEPLRQAILEEGGTPPRERAGEGPAPPASQLRGQDQPAVAGAPSARPEATAFLAQMAASAPADPGSAMPRLTVDDTPGDGEEQEGRRARLVVSGTLPSLGDYLVVLDCGARRYDVRVILAADPGPEVRRTIADLIGAGCEQGRALGRLEVTTGELGPGGS